MKKSQRVSILYILLICLVCIYLYKQFTYTVSGFDSSIEGINSILGKSAGFYSTLFFTINHYIYSKRHNINFKVSSDNWMFKSKIGWEDYFEPFNIKLNNNLKQVVKEHGEALEDYPIQVYRETIPLIYKYNRTTKKYIENSKEKLNLVEGYDSIFIRRGDKIISGESKYESVDRYISLLLLKNPYTKCVYVQTDDYSVIIEIKDYINKNDLQIDIKTLCTPSEGGAIVNKTFKQLDKWKTFGDNENNYVKKNKQKLLNTKSVDEMNPTEVYNHTISLITGVDIVCNSNICICDYQSNVGRFIKLFHKNPSRVFNIDDPDSDIDYNKKICPAYSF